MQSKVIYANDTILNSVKVTITGTGTSLTFYLGTSETWDGTYAWEEISGTTAQIHSLVATAGKFLKWKLSGTSYTITQIKLKINP